MSQKEQRILEAVALGDEEALERITAAEPIRRRPRRKELEEEPGQIRKTRSKKEKAPAPTVILIEEAKEVKKKEVAKTQIKPNPFRVALNCARLITTKFPETEQPKELAELTKAMKALSENDQRQIVFNIQKGVMEDQVPMQALFAVVPFQKMWLVAHNTGCVKKAEREDNLKFGDLERAGLVVVKKSPHNGNPYTVYMTGRESLEKAAITLRQIGKIQAANIIQQHLRRNERKKRLRGASQEKSPARTEEKVASES